MNGGHYLNSLITYNKCCVLSIVSAIYFPISKVDSLFPISHFLNFYGGGPVIIRAPVTLPGVFHVDWKISPL